MCERLGVGAETAKSVHRGSVIGGVNLAELVIMQQLGRIVQ